MNKRKKKIVAAFLLPVLCLTVFFLCYKKKEETGVKYIFLFIGDGMGINQVKAAEEYFGEKMIFQDFPVTGIMTTDNAEGKTTDSAAGITAIVTGKKTDNGFLSMSPDGLEEYTTLMELAKSKGYTTGIITTAPVNHATPAGFYAHESSRNNYDSIAEAAFKSGTVDFLAGGRFLCQDSEKMKKEEEKASDRITFLYDNKEIRDTPGGRLQLPAILQISSVFSLQYMECELDRVRMEEEGEKTVSLAQLVNKGIEAMEKEGSFFMAVESGMIDSACHKGDLASAVWETKALQDAVGQAAAFMEEHPEETLIVVLADHETGGLTLKYKHDLKLLENQTVSFARYARILEKLDGDEELFWDSIKECFGIGYGKELYFGKAQLERMEKMAADGEYREEDILGLLTEKADISFSTDYHTNQPVPVYAAGTGGENFGGWKDNTEIYDALLQAMSKKKGMN